MTLDAIFRIISSKNNQNLLLRWCSTYNVSISSGSYHGVYQINDCSCSWISCTLCQLISAGYASFFILLYAKKARYLRLFSVFSFWFEFRSFLIFLRFHFVFEEERKVKIAKFDTIFACVFRAFWLP